MGRLCLIIYSFSQILCKFQQSLVVVVYATYGLDSFILFHIGQL